MRIGLIGAMAAEIEALLAAMEEKTQEQIGSFVFYLGKISGVDCVLVQCGIGKVAAAVCTQTLLLKFCPDAVVNLGVAGGIGKEVRIGDLVLSEAVVEHDMNTTALGDPPGYLSGLDLVYIKSDPRLLSVFAETAELLGIRVHRGVIATGDLFVSSAKQAQKLAERFSAKACEMEGGSVGHACRLMNVPFLVLRSISDNADDLAKVDYPQFVTESAKRYGALIRSALPRIASVFSREEVQ